MRSQSISLPPTPLSCTRLTLDAGGSSMLMRASVPRLPRYEVAAGAEVWQGEKRYTDFEQLHNNVVEILGEAATGVLEVRNMALPPKRYVGNLTPEVGDERLLVLQHYLTQLGHLASLAAAATDAASVTSISTSSTRPAAEGFEASTASTAFSPRALFRLPSST